MVKVKIGIIGGTGFNAPDILTNPERKHVSTPFGECSDYVVTGTIQGIDCVLLARHCQNHSIIPSLVNYRANIWALKTEGCTHVLVTTACGSLKEEIQPGDIVLLTDFIDRTYKRTQTFYDKTKGGPMGTCHIPLHEPFCPTLKNVLVKCIDEMGVRYHPKGIVVTVEGPRFSSRAESNMFRLWGADVVNMTIVPEVVLAKEAGMSYAALALVTDYDCWREGDDHVHVDKVMKTMRECATKARDLILNAIPKIGSMDWDNVMADNQQTVNGAVM